jgi:hypothetical protein
LRIPTSTTEPKDYLPWRRLYTFFCDTRNYDLTLLYTSPHRDGAYGGMILISAHQYMSIFSICFLLFCIYKGCALGVLEHAFLAWIAMHFPRVIFRFLVERGERPGGRSLIHSTLVYTIRIAGGKQYTHTNRMSKRTFLSAAPDHDIVVSSFQHRHVLVCIDD